MEQVVEGLTNVLNPTEDDNEDTIIKMANKTSQSTHMLPQLMQKVQQI